MNDEDPSLLEDFPSTPMSPPNDKSADFPVAVLSEESSNTKLLDASKKEVEGLMPQTKQAPPVPVPTSSPAPAAATPPPPVPTPPAPPVEEPQDEEALDPLVKPSLKESMPDTENNNQVTRKEAPTAVSTNQESFENEPIQAERSLEAAQLEATKMEARPTTPEASPFAGSMADSNAVVSGSPTLGRAGTL
jgi:hypothetical protein